MHLFFHGGPHVVSRYDRAKAARCGDGLQARDARTHHQHTRGGNGPGRGHHHRKELAQLFCGHQHGLVAGRGSLRGKRVHRLRTRDARHQLEAESRDSLRSERAHDPGVCSRLQEADKHAAPGQQPHLGLIRRLHLQHRAGVLHQRGFVSLYRHAGRLIDRVRQVCGSTRARLTGDLEPGGDELGGGVGDESHAPLPSRRFLGNRNLHRTRNVAE